MSSEPCSSCEGESVYTCGCCPDCGRNCDGASGRFCELKACPGCGQHDCLCAIHSPEDYDDEPLDFDDNSDEDDFDPYEE